MLEAPVTVSGREAPSNFVSLFSGAGGLDLGLEQAGWNCRYASDIDAAAVASLEANRGFDLGLGRRAFANSHIEQADIRNLTAATVLAKSGLRKGDISVLAGGPPCQSWSSAGHQHGFADPRGRLFEDFVQFAGGLDVRWLVLENVRGLLTARGSDGQPGNALALMRRRLLVAGFVANVAEAKALYLDNLRPEEVLADWNFAVRSARRAVAAALRDSGFLRDIAGALKRNCGHSLAFRHLMAPPVSQDQFKLLCPQWSKSAENKSRPATPESATAAERVIQARLNKTLIRWSAGRRPPNMLHVRPVLTAIPILIAQQKVATARRNRLAFEQEYAVMELLERDGWIKLASKLIDTRAAVPPKHFMHKTRFATGTTAPQEVDIACGLRSTVVLALECKVTNDETNSVKRINDVIKKGTAWKEHWGNFVLTAALLQGVVAAKDVQRLTDANVSVFWSHELDNFRSWLTAHL